VHFAEAFPDAQIVATACSTSAPPSRSSLRSSSSKDSRRYAKKTGPGLVLERADLVGGTIVVRAADLVLLKLYAGGLQDAWDVQQLLARPFRAELIREVESRLSDLPARCHDLWKKVQQG
jgi:hypothetical protein